MTAAGIRLLLLAVLLATVTGTARGQSNTRYDAQWIWYDAGNPALQAPAGKVWFRREVPGNESSTCEARVLCDDRFALWVNGRRIGQGESGRLYRFSLNGIVGRGSNVIAVEAENRGGKAGLFVDGEIRAESGNAISFDTGEWWLATNSPPTGSGWLQPKFDASTWKPAKVIGPHAASPWKSIVLEDTDLDRFSVPPGFELTRIAEPKMVGSLIAMTWGNRGRLIVSRENGPILSVIDDDGDGIYDRVVEYSDKIKNCQGLCTVGANLYAVGSGPNGTGIYRLPDTDQNDKADDVELIHHHKANMAEHGPHNVILGPDGWLYYNLGNLGSITNRPEPTTACRDWGEDYLLVPRYEAAGEVFRGLRAPGGTIWRFSPDGERWWCEANGFRNEYDFAFNAAGDMFTVDSDMEWDEGTYLYRPVRVNHCVPGAEFGWRAGTGVWPPYYFDSLPATVDIGRGSPTGVVFYEHSQFPERLRGSLLVGDWSLGRILAVHLKKSGATYSGRFETLLSGNPLNVCDIAVDRDGSIVFVTGGRRTEGGIYRLRYTAGSKRRAEASTVADLLKLPQIEAAWAREIAERVKEAAGSDWAPSLAVAARSGTADVQIRGLTLLNQLGPAPDLKLLIDVCQSKDAGVRAFATHLLGFHSEGETRAALVRLISDPDATVRRRACEAFVRNGIEAPLDGVMAAIASEDRWLRFAGRIALEHLPREKWFEGAVRPSNTHALLEMLLAGYRGDRSGAGMTMLKSVAPLLCDPKAALSDDLKMDALRLVQLALLQKVRNETSAAIGRALFDGFPSGHERVDVETAEILAVLNLEGTSEKLMQLAERSPVVGQQLHYVLALRYLRQRPDLDLERRLMAWYEKSRTWEGGSALTGYAASIVGTFVRGFAPGERKYFVLHWKQFPMAAALILRLSRPDEIFDFPTVVSQVVSDCVKSPGGREDELIGACMACLDSEVASTFQRLEQTRDPQGLRRKLLHASFELEPDNRASIATMLARKPTPKDWPLFIRALPAADATAMQSCLRALAQLDVRPESADAFRTVIQAGLRLGRAGGARAVGLLERWTGVDRRSGDDVLEAIAVYQKWYVAKFPSAPPPELPNDDPAKSKYSYQQLVDLWDDGKPGSTLRGREVFIKSRCARCHRLRNEGESIGPDLSAVRRRFQRREIIESVVFPSQVISDQYRMVQVRTKDGRLFGGMPLTSVSGGDSLRLLLSDGSKVEIGRQQIEEQTHSNTSVMPTGLLDALTSQEIVDLFAFLDTTKG